MMRRRDFCSAAAAAAVAAQTPPEANYDEAKVPAYTLPDPLQFENGAPVSAAGWRRRRAEILRLFEEEVYGRTPAGRPKGLRFEVLSAPEPALGGAALRKQVRIHFSDAPDGPAMDLLLYFPQNSGKKVPAFLGLNFMGNQAVANDPAVPLNRNWLRNSPEFGIVDNRATEASRGARASRWALEKITSAGFALATACYADIAPDNRADAFRRGVMPLFYRKGQTAPEPGEWGAIGAWAWALSRALDYLEQEPLIDARRVAVMGHSRLGKTALWAGAQDERFALVVANNSGCMGAALSRRRFGETIALITKLAPYWFCGNFLKYANREDELPVDQHMLVALCAPRPVYVASAAEDLWADPRGEFLSLVHATPVYRLLGKEGLPAKEMPPLHQPVMGTLGYHIRAGKHDVTGYDWEQFLAFARRHLGAGNA
ncbi:MAG: acetylxylan esterase [Bryobacteraceae bacterium]